MATAQANAAAPLDQLLVDIGAGPLLDQAKAGLPAACVSKAMLDRAAASSVRKGYLDGATLAELFAWLLPGDLIWNYWVNNYLLGREPPVFDILSWNAGTTRMSAALHRDFLTVRGTNQPITPGAATMMGTPVDLSAVRVDNYVVAGVAGTTGLAPLADAPGTYVSESCDFTSAERKGSGHDVGNTDYTAGRSSRHANAIRNGLSG